MAERYRAAPPIDAIRIGARVLEPCEHDGREGLVDLEAIDAVERHARALKKLPRRRHDRRQHHHRIVAGEREMRDRRARLKA